MLSPFDEIVESLEILELPTLIQKEDIKKQYHFLAKKNHPDAGGDAEVMERLNHAYKLLIEYIEGFKYSFDEEEVAKQFPGADYVNRFRP
jgi:DnaJ-class molecular chaperone